MLSVGYSIVEVINVVKLAGTSYSTVVPASRWQAARQNTVLSLYLSLNRFCNCKAPLLVKNTMQFSACINRSCVRGCALLRCCLNR
jgi:hypothetical protein